MLTPTKCAPVKALVTVTVGLAAFAIGTARAADQGITGKKLLLKSGKFVLLSKDPTISNTGSDPVGGSDSSITFNDGSGPVSLAAPKTLWTASSSGTLFKYKNPDAPGGPSIVKVGKVGSGLLKAVGKGAPVAVPNGSASIDVVLSLDGGTNKYCMTFIGTGDGAKFLVKDAAAGTCPGGGSVCGNNVKEGPEQCDGSDATDCPGNCTANCTCPITCPATGGDATACLAYTDVAGPCRACVDANAPGDFACPLAFGYQCLNSTYDDSCSAVVNTQGCGSECCPSCGNDVREGIETCDGSDDSACPGSCQANCTCPVCGDNVREGTEQCDGTDDAACPGNCSAANCTCSCAATSGDATACMAFGDVDGACRACMDANAPAGDLLCPAAVGGSCMTAAFNDACSTDVNTYGCGAECCLVSGCGNNIREGTEACDGSSDAACPGQCQANCTCPQSCGNNVREGTEQCDGSDASSCPGNCQAGCTCPAQTCGNNVREGLELCDGSDDAFCPGQCQANCTCPGGGTCGNAIREGSEQCDGHDGLCPLDCEPNCTCQPSTCGNNVREGIELCDGSDDAFCTGQCQANCTCPGTCPLFGDATACNNFDVQDPNLILCITCCSSHTDCVNACGSAQLDNCTDTTNFGSNHDCALAMNSSGCYGLCCP